MSNTPASIAIDEEGAHDGCQVEQCPIIGAGKICLIEMVELTRSGRPDVFRRTAA
jgi:hypothetical protein